MKLTKYQHACLVIEKEGRKLIIDPGNYSDDFVVPDGVIAVMLTHKHADHVDSEKLSSLFMVNPEALLIGPGDTLAEIEHAHKQIALANKSLDIGPFHLHFYGGQHATIHRTMPPIENIGVLVDGKVYYPGDSFALPDDTIIDTLALPVAAPWMKIGEAIDFYLTIKPRFAFPTHDAIYSRYGQEIADQLMARIAAANGIEYRRITGETITID